MLLNGVKKLKTLNLSLLFFLWVTCICADDYGIAMPDQIKEEDSIIEKTKEDEDDDRAAEMKTFIIGGGDESILENSKETSGTFSLPGGVGEADYSVSSKEEVLSTGAMPPHSMEGRENYLEYTNDEILDGVYDKGESVFSFSYIKDTYDVEDDKGVFERSFERAPDSIRGGSLHFFMDNYFTRGYISPFWGGGFGLGYSQGKGLFSSSSGIESNSKFLLYTVPLDLRLGFDLGRGEYLKFSFAGGPSVVGLLQTRTDREKDDRDKYLRQVGYGYFAHGKMQISLNPIFESMAFETYSLYKMSNTFLNIELRMQEYGNFQDNVTISGLSFGVGFSFEYL